MQNYNRNTRVTFFLLLLMVQFVHSQKQNILNQTDKLAATAKIWGFLKYYHPEVAKGSFDWDEQLFEKLEEVEKTETKKELSKLFMEWIDELGEVPENEQNNVKSNNNLFTQNLDLSWIESGIFDPKLENKLRLIEKNRLKEDHYYVTAADQVGSAVFTNEKEYNSFIWEEENLRLLALFRYWNQVEYFFPYKYQMDEDWGKVLEKMLPLFLNPASEIEYHLAMQELISNLDDSHAHLITPQLNNRTGFYWVPVKLQMIGNKAVVVDYMDKSLAEKEDWKLGDIVLAVNDVPITEIIEQEERFLTGSNLASKYRDIQVPLLNGNSNSVEVDILRDESQIKKKVTRYYKKEFNSDKSLEKWKLLDGNIGYVDLGLLEREDVDKMFQEFSNTDGIIFDIRKYPRGTWYAIATHLHKGDFVVGKSLIPVIDYPGKFKFTEPMLITHSNPNAYDEKVVLLINEYTQSQAEYTVMALETAPKVTTIGRPTSGTNGNVTDVSLVGGYTTYMSGLGVFHPDGRETQRVGISPDIKVETTIETIQKGEDEILQSALDFLHKE